MGAFEYLTRGERNFVPLVAPQRGDIVESGWRVGLHCTRDCRSRIGSGEPAVLALINGAQEKRDAESAGRNERMSKESEGKRDRNRIRKGNGSD